MKESRNKSPEKEKNKSKNLEKKKFQDKKNIKKDCINKKTSTKLEVLKECTNYIWHSVKEWESLWWILNKLYKKNKISQIPESKIQWVAIFPWDKIYISNEYIIIKYLSWETKRISLKNKDVKKKQKNKIFTPSNDWIDLVLWEINKLPFYEPSKDSLDLVNWIINDYEIKNSEDDNNNDDEEPKKTWKISYIFDWNSPLKQDKINFENEKKIRDAYWDIIKNYIDIYCKWSVIDEGLFYWIMARESKFDPKAISHTWVKWLSQLTKDTIKTVANINEIRRSKNKETSDFYIVDDIITWKTKNKDWFYDINMSKALLPINQIKLAISFLLYLDKLFSDIPNIELKKTLIITAYNLWASKTKEIYNTYSWVKNWEWLEKALKRARINWEISHWKAKEVTEYVPMVKKYAQLALAK